MGEFILAKSMAIDPKLFSLAQINHMQQSSNGWYMNTSVVQNT